MCGLYSGDPHGVTTEEMDENIDLNNIVHAVGGALFLLVGVACLVLALTLEVTMPVIAGLFVGTFMSIFASLMCCLMAALT